MRVHPSRLSFSRKERHRLMERWSFQPFITARKHFWLKSGATVWRYDFINYRWAEGVVVPQMFCEGRPFCCTWWGWGFLASGRIRLLRSSPRGKVTHSKILELQAASGIGVPGTSKNFQGLSGAFRGSQQLKSPGVGVRVRVSQCGGRVQMLSSY